jgi:hypothetical protein
VGAIESGRDVHGLDMSSTALLNISKQQWTSHILRHKIGFHNSSQTMSNSIVKQQKKLERHEGLSHTSTCTSRTRSVPKYDLKTQFGMSLGA